jgi:hypothetical protein
VRRLLPLATLLLLIPIVPSFAGGGPTVSTRSPRATIRGSVGKVDAIGCGSRATTGCDEHPFAVSAPAGTWVTVTVPHRQELSLLRIATSDGDPMGESGERMVTNGSAPDEDPGQVTFRQPRRGTVRYVLGVSTANPDVLTKPWSYAATVALGGNAWDREQDCTDFEPDVVPPVPADTTKRLRLSVLVVTPPALLAEVRRESAVIVSDYARINIAVRLTVVSARLPGDGDPQHMFDYLRARYGGERPRGVDVVYAASDYFAGGVADCLGGVRFPERAFAMGQVHYTAQGVPVPADGGVKMGHIAAHEIGHLLGAQHHFSNCAQGEPSAATSGDAGPCTIMNPAALTGSGQWSTLETAFVRYHVERFADR